MECFFYQMLRQTKQIGIRVLVREVPTLIGRSGSLLELPSASEVAFSIFCVVFVFRLSQSRSHSDDGSELYVGSVT